MRKYSSIDLLVAGRTAQDIAEKNSQSSVVYGHYNDQLKTITKEFADSLRETKKHEIEWYKNIGEEDLKDQAVWIYIKYKNLLQKDLNGADLVKWNDPHNVTSDELITALEDIAEILEEHSELIYSQSGNDEVVRILDELDKELNKNDKSRDSWEKIVSKKNELQDKLLSLFKKFRQFVRRDQGYDSSDYEMLKDRAIKIKAVKEPPDA